VSKSITTSVEVARSPEAAFDVFTQEIDAWYVVDREALPDITRTAAIRFEPHVGGRLLDVHDLATGAGRQLGQITAWEPGHRLCFTDNEGTEVNVEFEPCGTGTRVTLTHSDLVRPASERDEQQRPSGWTTLAPFYREHLAPNALPLAVAVALWALFFTLLVGTVALQVLLELPIWASGLTAVPLLAVIFGFFWIENRVVRRWLPSAWQYRRISLGLLGLLALGGALWGLYDIIEHGADVFEALGGPLVLLLAVLTQVQKGPARGRSLRKRAGSANTTSTRRRTAILLLLAVAFAGVGTLGSVFSSVDTLDGVFMPAMLALFGALKLHTLLAKRNEKQTLGFDPDRYLAVGRSVTESNERPRFLFYDRSCEKLEYSGWYAYSSEHHENPDELVAWSMKDLITHSPEAARVLREGSGTWEWDQSQRTYQRLDISAKTQPAS